MSLYYDSYGNEINDETLKQDIARGATVIKYHEEKKGEDTTIVRESKRIIRKRERTSRL